MVWLAGFSHTLNRLAKVRSPEEAATDLKQNRVLGRWLEKETISFLSIDTIELDRPLQTVMDRPKENKQSLS